MTLKQKHHHNTHKPVLLEEVLNYLQPKEKESFLDLTGGYGGHAFEVLKKTKSPEKMVLIDRDINAIKYLQKISPDKRVEIRWQDYKSATSDLTRERRKFDMILADLGVSSPQLDIGERGFSFTNEGPLDMRMNQSTGVTAADLVNTLPEQELARLIREYSEEPNAKKIAKAIVANRPLNTTKQLADITATAIGHRRQKTHPATRTFQALRIAVNDELGQLEQTLRLLPDLMNPDGRLVIISFHSLEDRITKNILKEFSSSGYEAKLSLLTKRPVQGTTDVFNPRARSAKLRAAVKIKN